MYILFVAAVLFSSFVFTITVNAQDTPQCSTIEECAQKAMEAAFQAKKALQLAVPPGAVMAFNLTKCPEGWSDFVVGANRVIVGMGNSRGLLSTGGQTKTDITDLKRVVLDNSAETGGIYNGKEKFSFHWVFGQNYAQKPDGNMPPFITLLYCERQ